MQNTVQKSRPYVRAICAVAVPLYFFPLFNHFENGSLNATKEHEKGEEELRLLSIRSFGLRMLQCHIFYGEFGCILLLSMFAIASFHYRGFQKKIASILQDQLNLLDESKARE